jgi:hypothetical protein
VALPDDSPSAMRRYCPEHAERIVVSGSRPRQRETLPGDEVVCLSPFRPPERGGWDQESSTASWSIDRRELFEFNDAVIVRVMK